MSVETCLFRSSLGEFETCLPKRPEYEVAYGTGFAVTSERAARYRSVPDRCGAAAYPETDLAPRDRIRAGRCAATPFPCRAMASTAPAAAGRHRRPGDAGPAVRPGGVARPVRRAVGVPP